jgi:hypothetical protein
MPLGLAVLLVVLSVTAVTGLVGYLVNRSAEINDRKEETK